MKAVGPLLLALAIVATFSAGPAGAQSGGGFELSRDVVAGGGGALAGGDFELDGTVGEIAAGNLAAGDYALGSGFWRVAFALPGIPIPAASAAWLALLAVLLTAAGLRAARRRVRNV